MCPHRFFEQHHELAEWQDAIDNRNWLIHQYDHVDRQITWQTLATDLRARRQALDPLILDAEKQAAAEPQSSRRELIGQLTHPPRRIPIITLKIS